jgi:hypothetical protein
MGHLQPKLQAVICLGSGRGFRLWMVMAPRTEFLERLDLPRGIINNDSATTELQQKPGWRTNVKGKHLVIGVTTKPHVDVVSSLDTSIQGQAYVIHVGDFDHDVVNALGIREGQLCNRYRVMTTRARMEESNVENLAWCKLTANVITDLYAKDSLAKFNRLGLAPGYSNKVANTETPGTERAKKHLRLEGVL